MQFHVPDMSCGHCTAAIESALKEADPAAEVACDLETHNVTVTSALAADAVQAAMQKAGYASELLAA